MKHQNLLKSFLYISYITIIGLIVFGVSSAYSYLNTGADRSSMLNTEVYKTVPYTPKVYWQSLKNEGRKIDGENLSNITNDYLKAWFVKHNAFASNTTQGIYDYYTKKSAKNIYNSIQKNKNSNTTIHGTTLQHNLNLEFFSEDGQMAVLTDENVIIHQQVFIDNTFIDETSEKANFKVILLLEDGFWRIRHLVKITSEKHNPTPKPIATDNLNIKGINYYPKDTPWDTFGDKFSLEIITKDFDIIKNAGLNTLRIFIPYEDFGKENLKPEKLDKLELFLNEAHKKQLKVIPTLFDFYGNYAVSDWTFTQKHARNIIHRFKNHNAIIAWDIKNEPDLDFKSRGKQQVLAWLKSTIDVVKSIDTIHPVTIGWSNPESANLIHQQVDFVSFHYYKDLNNLEAALNSIKNNAPEKEIVLTEFGISSYKGFWNPFGESKKDQANYHKKAQEIFTKNNLQFMSWTLYDFDNIPNAVIGKLPWRKLPQKKFGFIDSNGKPKPAFEFISN